VLAAQVLVYSFRVLLVLIHPLMPFVTERLWAIMPVAQGQPQRPPLLITSAWPSHSGAVDEGAIAQYQVRAHGDSVI
jgi:valyl-tRNA synthetase